MHQIERVVSGGQTGVDRAALDAAMVCGVPIGGWCPRGRRAEDGSIAAHYPLQETPSDAYVQRTAWNVRDSDGTLVLLFSEPIGGTTLTIEETQRRGKPCHVQRIGPDTALRPVVAWLCQRDIRVLNVAGPRESEAPGIYVAARTFLVRLFAEPDADAS